MFDTREHLSGGIITPSTSMNQGLAEFTNTNFFSEDTSFAGGLSTGNSKYFAYPAKSETNLQSYIDNTLDVAPMTDADGRTMSYFKISKQTTSGIPLSCLAKAGPNSKKYYNKMGEGAAFYKSFRVDDECFEEYSKYLFPRAVAYSKALLDYFFRGKIDISVPANGLYSMIPGTATNFTSIKLFAKNSSIAGEEMTGGSIELVVKYKLAQQDPFKSGSVPTSADFSYIVAPEKNNVSLISRAYTEFNFDLSQTPIPLYATDVYLQLVYKGRLGNEDGAVAVGFKDISEPTPIDMFNNMDKICINGSWYEAGSQDENVGQIYYLSTMFLRKS